jgi:hypothetical protein
MKNNINWPIFIITFLTIVLISYFFYTRSSIGKGRVYSDKQTLCMDFAQSYLKTIRKTDLAKTDNEKWEIAIDVETELYDMCLLDLNKEAIKQYHPNAFDKYKQ